MKTHVLLAAAAALAGCGTAIHVEVDAVRSMNYRTLRSWAWYPEPPPTGKNDSQQLPERSKQTIRTSIKEELSARGFAETTPENADFLISWTAGIGSHIETYGTMTAYGYDADAYFIETAPMQREYAEGSLMVDFVLAKPPKKMFWRGVAQATVKASDTSDDRQKLIRDAVAKMLAQFPPQ